MSIYVSEAFQLEKVKHDLKFIMPHPDATRTSLLQTPLNRSVKAQSKLTDLLLASF